MRFNDLKKDKEERSTLLHLETGFYQIEIDEDLFIYLKPHFISGLYIGFAASLVDNEEPAAEFRCNVSHLEVNTLDEDWTETQEIKDIFIKLMTTLRDNNGRLEETDETQRKI